MVGNTDGPLKNKASRLQLKELSLKNRVFQGLPDLSTGVGSPMKRSDATFLRGAKQNGQ
jgi:hypothetical protein